ncbi:Cyclin-dependent kinase 10, partial [Stegodyphus mimosarum]
MSTSSTMADSGSKIQDSEKKRRREKIVRLTLEILESEKDYQVLNILGCGTYGDVFQIYDSKRDIEIAAKIVTSDNISEMELSLWPKLNHPNIVPLLELFTLNLLDVVIFIMPLQYKTLHDLLFDTRFSKSRNSSFYVKRWFFEILCAISYMHEHEMCHLDIKVDNVLITHTFSAMLCDFSFLNETA